MTNKDKASSLKLEQDDLCKQAVRHVAFLKAVDCAPALKNIDNLKHALYRYEKYWLPLAAEHGSKCLVAPLDIEWIWHCHMLCPLAYETDCHALVGVTVNHALYSEKAKQDKLSESRLLWSQKYPSKEPFMVDYTASYDVEKIETFKSRISYDLISAAQRQSVFYYQVSLPHYTDKKYLENSLLRYKQFLYLKTQLPGDFLVPCYDIDLIWHTHQLNPLLYKTDMMNIIGHLFNHDDSVNDRSEGSKLYIADKQTRESWKKFYNESFSNFGAMYRGYPPTGYLYKLTFDDCYKVCTKTCTIAMDQLILTFLPNVAGRQYRNVKLTATISAGNKVIRPLFKVKRPSESRGSTTVTWRNLGQFDFETKSANNITFQLDVKTGRGCCGINAVVGSNSINLLPEVESPSKSGGKAKSRVGLAFNVQLDVEWSFSPPKKDKCLLFLDKGTYETAIIPENIKELWGPVSLERLPSNTDNHCNVASHRLKNHLGSVEFTARTIHSQPLMMSVVQVFYHDKLSVIGHLIASDQLPLPTQVVDDHITLNPKVGERAVLLKNNKGDWGILTGRWGGVIRGVKRTRQSGGVPGCPGTLYLRFYKMSTGKTSTFTLGYLTKNYTYNFESAAVDLMKGIIDADPRSNEVAENIALAFSVSLLHVLCVPRPKDWKEGTQVKRNVVRRGGLPVTTTPSDDMAFIVAAGLLCGTPSNYYIHNTYGTHMCAMCGGGGDGITCTEYEGNWGDLPGGDSYFDGGACGSGETTDAGGPCGAGCGGCGGCGGGGGGGYGGGGGGIGGCGASCGGVGGDGSDGGGGGCGSSCGGGGDSGGGGGGCGSSCGGGGGCGSSCGGGGD